MTLIDLFLVSFGLIASQVGVKARKNGLRQGARAIGPLELAKEVCHQCCAWLTLVDTGVLVHLTGENGIVSADLRVAVDEVLQLEEPRRVGAGDIVIHVDIWNGARTALIDRDQGLEGGSSHKEPA